MRRKEKPADIRMGGAFFEGVLAGWLVRSKKAYNTIEPLVLPDFSDVLPASADVRVARDAAYTADIRRKAMFFDMFFGDERYTRIAARRWETENMVATLPTVRNHAPTQTTLCVAFNGTRALRVPGDTKTLHVSCAYPSQYPVTDYSNQRAESVPLLVRRELRQHPALLEFVRWCCARLARERESDALVSLLAGMILVDCSMFGICERYEGLRQALSLAIPGMRVDEACVPKRGKGVYPVGYVRGRVPNAIEQWHRFGKPMLAKLAAARPHLNEREEWKINLLEPSLV